MMAIVVTRHAGLVDILIEDGLVPANAPVLAHATPADVRGRHVYGVVPLSLAAEAALVTTADLTLPPELRGRELTAAEVRRYLTGYTTYSVCVVSNEEDETMTETPQVVTTAHMGSCRCGDCRCRVWSDGTIQYVGRMAWQRSERRAYQDPEPLRPYGSQIGHRAFRDAQARALLDD